MTHEEWAKEVKKTLIDREERVPEMAVKLRRSPEWVYMTLSGRLITEQAVKKISDYLGIGNYMEDKK